jgi:hypothetical protein
MRWSGTRRELDHLLLLRPGGDRGVAGDVAHGDWPERLDARLGPADA